MKKEHKKGRICLIIGLVLILAAAGLTGYNLLTVRQAQKRTQHVMEQLAPVIDEVRSEVQEQKRQKSQAPAGIADQIPIPDYQLNPRMDMPTQTIDGNEYIGVISLPTLELELPVMSDWDYQKLIVAPCRYSGSIYTKDAVFCAHNYYVHFGLIDRLSLGDTIVFTDVDGNVFTYEVLEIETLYPMQVKEMKTGDWDLTLFTCTIGGRTRVTVRCMMVDG